MRSSATHRAVEAVWRIESARLIAGPTRIVRDLSVAEDLAQDALLAGQVEDVQDDVLRLIFMACRDAEDPNGAGSQASIMMS